MIAEVQSEKEKANMEKDIFDIFHDVKVNVRRPDSISVKNVKLGLNNLVRYLNLLSSPSPKSSSPRPKTKPKPVKN